MSNTVNTQVNSSAPSAGGSFLTENCVSRNLATLARKIMQISKNIFDVCIIQFKPREDKAFYYLASYRYREKQCSDEDFAIHDLLKAIVEGDFNSFASILKDCNHDYFRNYFAICNACLKLALTCSDSPIKTKMVEILNKELSKIPDTKRLSFVPTPNSDYAHDSSCSSITKKILGGVLLSLLFLTPAAYFLLRNNSVYRQAEGSSSSSRVGITDPETYPVNDSAVHETGPTEAPSGFARTEAADHRTCPAATIRDAQSTAADHQHTPTAEQKPSHNVNYLDVVTNFLRETGGEITLNELGMIDLGKRPLSSSESRVCPRESGSRYKLTC